MTSLNKTAPCVRSLDVGEISETIQRALASAGLDRQSGPMQGVTGTIQQALSGAGLTQRSAAKGPKGAIVEGAFRGMSTPDISTHTSRFGRIAPAEQAYPGEFISRSFANRAGKRTYRLYIPASYSERSDKRVPLMVMLHGCTQSPDDFAAGTRMNELAEKHGFLVVYPAQAAKANGSRCWNWFRAKDQSRDRGEPSLIAGITREVASKYHVDEGRIFIAGLSAGAAMAVVLGATYPELYAGVGAHSGLPYGAAHDMPSALAAMKSGVLNAQATQTPRRPQFARAMPTIVFHGDCDHTVDAQNSAAIVEQATTAGTGEIQLHASVDEGATSDGRTFSRTIYADGTNHPVVERWVLHGAGHAWSGGSPRGSFTDARGPDASAEMIRFFYLQQHADGGLAQSHGPDKRSRRRHHQA